MSKFMIEKMFFTSGKDSKILSIWLFDSVEELGSGRDERTAGGTASEGPGFGWLPEKNPICNGEE